MSPSQVRRAADAPIEEVEMGVRPYNILKRGFPPVRTLGHLAFLTDGELADMVEQVPQAGPHDLPYLRAARGDALDCLLEVMRGQ